MKPESYLCRIELKPDRQVGTPTGVPIELMTLVCGKFPEYVTAYGWSLVGIPLEDPLIQSVLSYFSDIGLNIPIDRSKMNTGVKYSIYRSDHWDRVLDSPFTCATLTGSILADFVFIDDAEPMVVCNSRLTKNKGGLIGGVFAFPQIIVVREAMKKILTDFGLAGISFRPLSLAKVSSTESGCVSEIEWPKDIESIYQLTSEIELPTCKNWMFDNKGRVFHPSNRNGLSDGCMPLNGREHSAALHYSIEEIDQYLAYDVVKTYENVRRGKPEVLVSKRFREVFKQLGIRGMKYNLGHYALIDEIPWPLGTDGPRHPRYSGPPPNPPVG
ncbi:MAG: hypothetical protein MUF13_00330 [Akkermansiaceae bacterium]|jgi:hypothetical protein|nr:hypothetical protein [Akkermansiaceae bacterium]